MELLPYSDADLGLTVALESDPAVMGDLGGPVSASHAARIHRQRLADVARGQWFFTIVPDAATGPVGIVGIWETTWDGAVIHELGSMFLPAFQGRGLAAEVFAVILQRAKAEPRFTQLHAFPAAANRPSNAACLKLGFAQVGECDLDYEGRALHCNHWVLDLATDPPRAPGATGGA